MARTIAKDHAEKRRHILAVAAEVFARQGIARASMNEVAGACGISKANIYHYYGSKDALVFDILDSYLAGLRDSVAKVHMEDLSSGEQLHRVCETILLAYEGMDHEHQIQTEGLPLLPAEQQERLRGYQRDMVKQVSGIIAGCAPAHIAQDPAKMREITMSVFGMLNWFYRWHPKATREDRISYARTIADLTLNGVIGR